MLTCAAPKQPPDDERLDISSQSTASLHRSARAHGTGMRYSELHSSLVGRSQPWITSPAPHEYGCTARNM